MQFEDVVELKYLGLSAANQNYTNEEIQSTLNSDNACHSSFRKHFMFPATNKQLQN
jgi:hypothetical protein